MRGVRFNFVKRLVDATPREVFFKIADKIAPLGWHIVVYFEAQDLEGLTPFLKQLPTVIVVDHMGRPDIAKGVEHPDFQRFVDLMAENSNIWSKVSCPERLSVSGPPDYDDVAPFARSARGPLPGPRAVGHRLAAPEHEIPHARRRRAGGRHSAHCHNQRKATRPAGGQSPEVVLVRHKYTGGGKQVKPMSYGNLTTPIPGTVIFDGREAMKGYALNKMCYSFNRADNRDAFKRDEEAYMTQYGLNEQQKEAIRKRYVLDLIAAGGNIYYLAKFAGIFGLDVQDVGAQQTGMTKDDFKAMLARQGE